MTRCSPVKYLVVVERGRSRWGAHVPDLPGCTAVGETREDVIALVREAIELHLAALRERGEPVPEPASAGGSVEADAG